MGMRKIPRFRPYFNLRYNLYFIQYLLNKFNNKYFVRRFEKNFANYIGTRYAIATSSGTVSLYLCLKSLGCQLGDEIIISNYIVPEVISVIKLLKLEPVFVDIRRDTFNINPDLIEKKISKKTKCILMVHLFGQPCNVAKITQIARKHNLRIIEDAAQACGTLYKGKKTGNFGNLAYFSFGLLKNFNTLGGGIITTNNKKFYDYIKKEISNYKTVTKFVLSKRLLLLNMLNILTSRIIYSNFTYYALRFLSLLQKDFIYNFFKRREPTYFDKFSKKYFYLFSEFQARVGLDELKVLDKRNKARIKHAKSYITFLNKSKIQVPSYKDMQHIFLSYVFLAKNRDKLIRYFSEKGVYTSKGYANFYSSKDYKTENGSFVAKNIIYLPIYPDLDKKDIIYISNLVKDSIKNVESN